MTPARARDLAQRLVAKNSAPINWTRSFITPGGASGIATEASPPIVYQVRAVPIGPDQFDLLPEQWWQSAQVRLVLAAQGLPFDPEVGSGEPEVEFQDQVLWGGREYRVTGVQAFRHASPTVQARPFAYFVGLGA